jgi:chemotaxis protein MotB
MAKKAHHGGAWKVAYADFVTAMMALFMVLWICAQDKKILLATSKYFQSPFKSPLHANSGVMPYEKSTAQHDSSSSQQDQQGQNQASDKNKQIELSFLNSVAADFYRLIHLDDTLDEKPIDVQVTSDGLKMTLFDRARRPIFVENSSEFTPWGKLLMQNLAWLIDRHHFRVSIDGYTRAGIEFKKGDYSAWELSTDRANASRRSLVYYAVDPSLIERVTGYADTRPLTGVAPESESNQRIAISLTLLSRLSAESPLSPHALQDAGQPAAMAAPDTAKPPAL